MTLPLKGCARVHRLLGLTIACLLFFAAAALAQNEPVPFPPDFAKEAPSRVVDLSVYSGDVWVIPVNGDIELGLAAFVERAVDEAVASGAALILIEVNTFGGRVDAATEIRDKLLGADIPTAAFVTDRAWSAGALIALSADTIWMAPGTSIGAAQPIPTDEKTVSALRAEFESMAERTDRDPAIAASMVDINVEVEGVVSSDEILTLTANRAFSLDYAEGVIHSRQEILEALGLGGRRVIETAPNWAERVARVLTAPVITEILLTLAFLGLIAEATSPGWGIPGFVGLSALVLFLGGRMVVGLVGLEVVILLLVGVVLLAIEIFVIPGFGIAGIGGIAAIVGGLYLSFEGPDAALRALGVSTGLTLIGVFLLWRFGRRFGLWDPFILRTRLDDEGGYVAPSDFSGYLGKKGRSLTTLRPAGTIIIDDERVDAVSEGGYIPVDTPVKVVKVEGTRVIVRKLKEEPNEEVPSTSEPNT